MTFKADFAAVLAASAVTAVVGEKIFPGVAKQGSAKPYIVWRRNGGDPQPTLSPTAASRARLKFDMLVGCYAEDYDTAADLADKVFDALATGATSLRIIPRPPADGFDPETKLFASVVEASVSYRS